MLSDLALHPDRHIPENQKALKAAKAAVQRDLQKLEVIKPRIAKRHDEYLARRRAQQNALANLEGRGAQSRDLLQDMDGLAINPVAPKRPSYERPAIDAEEHRSLAAMLAQREVRRRDAARRSVRQAGVSEEEEHERRVGGMWGEWERELRRESAEGDDLSTQIQEVARLQNGHHAAPSFSVSTFYEP